MMLLRVLLRERRGERKGGFNPEIRGTPGRFAMRSLGGAEKGGEAFLRCGAEMGVKRKG